MENQIDSQQLQVKLGIFFVYINFQAITWNLSLNCNSVSQGLVKITAVSASLLSLLLSLSHFFGLTCAFKKLMNYLKEFT